MQTMQAVVLDALRELDNSQSSMLAIDVLNKLAGHKPTFVHGDGRYIYRDTIIKLYDGSVGMFCSHSYQEQKAILAASASGGGRWLRDGSFTLFKKDMEV